MSDSDNLQFGYGGGEKGVLIRNLDEYKSTLGVNDIIPYVEPICEEWEVRVPNFEIRPAYKTYLGKHYRTTGLIAICLPIMKGVVLHELAHFINTQKYGGKGHNWRFKYILGEILRVKGI